MKTINDLCDWLNSEDNIHRYKTYCVVDDVLCEQDSNGKTYPVYDFESYKSKHERFLLGKYGMFIKTYNTTIGCSDYRPNTYVLFLISELYHTKEDCNNFQIPSCIRDSELEIEMLRTSDLEQVTETIYVQDITYPT